MRESTISALIRKAIATDGRCIVTRNNVGIAIYPDGSRVKYGLGTGSADYVGMICRGEYRGRVFCLEIKRERDSTGRRRKAMQAAFARAVRMRGGFCGLARSVEDAIACVERACRGELQ
jgi:hypothetical protein